MGLLSSLPFPVLTRDTEPSFTWGGQVAPGCWLTGPQESGTQTQETDSDNSSDKSQERDELEALAVPPPWSSRAYSNSLWREWLALPRKGIKTKTLSFVRMADGGGGNAWAALTAFLWGENCWGVWGASELSLRGGESFLFAERRCSGGKATGPSRLGKQPGYFPIAVAQGSKTQAPLLPHKARSRLASRPSFLLPAGIWDFGEARQQGELTSGSQKRGVQWEPQKVPKSQGYRDESSGHGSFWWGRSPGKSQDRSCSQQHSLWGVWAPHCMGSAVSFLSGPASPWTCLAAPWAPSGRGGGNSLPGWLCFSAVSREAGEWGSCRILNKPNKEAPPS